MYYNLLYHSIDHPCLSLWVPPGSISQGIKSCVLQCNTCWRLTLAYNSIERYSPIQNIDSYLPWHATICSVHEWRIFFLADILTGTFVFNLDTTVHWMKVLFYGAILSCFYLRKLLALKILSKGRILIWRLYKTKHWSNISLFVWHV